MAEEKDVLLKQTAPRFNLIDLAILLTVLCVIFGTVLRFFLQYREKESIVPENAELTFLVTGLDNSLAAGIAQGKTVYYGSASIGTVKSADLSRAETFYVASDGTLKVAYSNEECDIRCILSVTGIESENGFLLSGTDALAPGMTIELKTDTLSFTALITDIDYLR